MSTYDPEYDLTQLMTDFKDCAIEAGFCPTGIKFGPPSAINFDHNICYDLLNIDYPSSYIVEGIKEVYTFELILARPVLSGSNQGVELFDDDAVQIFSELEFKLWTMLGCLALGISGGGGCRAHVPMHKVTIERFKGLHNDNLVVLAVRFDAIANIAVPPEPCGGSTAGLLVVKTLVLHSLEFVVVLTQMLLITILLLPLMMELAALLTLLVWKTQEMF